MNLTRIIEATGRRLRAGKMPADRLTNDEVKAVLETAIEVMKTALAQEERIEIQGFVVIELKRSAVKRVMLNGKETRGERRRWTIRVSEQVGDGDHGA